MNKLRTLRVSAGYNIKIAAELLGIKPCTLYKYESGERKPSRIIKWRMIKIYNCDPEEVGL